MLYLSQIQKISVFSIRDNTGLDKPFKKDDMNQDTVWYLFLYICPQSFVVGES